MPEIQFNSSFVLLISGFFSQNMNKAQPCIWWIKLKLEQKKKRSENQMKSHKLIYLISTVFFIQDNGEIVVEILEMEKLARTDKVKTVNTKQAN